MMVAEWGLLALMGAVFGWVVAQGRYAPGADDDSHRSPP